MINSLAISLTLKIKVNTIRPQLGLYSLHNSSISQVTKSKKITFLEQSQFNLSTNAKIFKSHTCALIRLVSLSADTFSPATFFRFFLQSIQTPIQHASRT